MEEWSERCRRSREKVCRKQQEEEEKLEEGRVRRKRDREE